jgi:radical SAM protein with 4Fe4S-binding SPASM domain
METSNIMRKPLQPPPSIKGHDFSKEEIENTRSRGTLLMISPCVSRACNFKCPYCYSDAGTQEEKNPLTFEDYKRVIQQAKDLGARTVRIGGWGEPFLDANFYEPKASTFPLIDYSNQLGMHVVFFTNSTLISSEIAQELIRRDVSVIPKIDTFRSEIQDKMTGVNGSFELVHKGIHNLINAGFLHTNPPRFAISAIISSYNYDELPSLYFLLREWNIIPYFELIMHGGRGKTTDIHVSKQQAKILFEKFLKIDEEHFGYTWYPLPPYVGFKCDKLYYNLVIDTDGEVYPCYGIKISLGNIRNQSLKEITTTKLFWKFRNIKRHMHGRCATCNIPHCDFGCRCDAFQVGDVFGNYEMCWHQNVSNNSKHRKGRF